MESDVLELGVHEELQCACNSEFTKLRWKGNGG